MYKIVGGILIITASTLMGCRAAGAVEEEYRQMRYLRQLIYMLQSEIRYTKAYLGEAFLHIGSKAKEPYGRWMMEMNRRLEEKGGGIFPDIWEYCTGQYLKEIKLPEEERERLISLGTQLGAADMEMQMQTLALYQEQLSLSMEERRDGMKTRMRLCHCLGVMGGIFLTVLLA